MGNCINFRKNIELKELRKQTASTCPFFTLKGQTMYAKVISVYDGDTCTVVLRLHGKFVKFRVRMLGYDSPEMKPPLNTPNRVNVVESAKVAKLELEKLILNKIVQIDCGDWDKYGRLLGKIYVGHKMCVNDYMLENGFGYKYDGGTKEKPNVMIFD